MLLRQLVPAGRRAGPVAGPARVLLVEEAARVDRGLVIVGVHGRQRRERHRSTLALGPGLCGVREDAKDPGLQRRALLEAVDAADDREPRLLNDLVRNGGTAHVGKGEPPERCVMACDEALEG